MSKAKKNPETAKQRQIREAIQSDLWEAFKGFVAECHKSRVYDSHDSEWWPHTFSEAVTMFHEDIGSSNSDRTFVVKFLEIFPPPPPKTYKFELALSDEDRKKILGDLDNQCLSDETKEAIKQALKSDDEDES